MAISTVKLYYLKIPHDPRFALASCVGTWAPLAPGQGGFCGGCQRLNQIRVSPLVVEWEPGSDVIGDFVWAPIFGLMISAPAAERLNAAGISGFALGPVVMQESRSSKQPKRATAARSTRVPQVRLPYDGAQLFDFTPNRHVRIDESRSTARRREACPVCGRYGYEVEGVERIDLQSVDPVRGRMMKRTPRIPGCGYMVRKAMLDEDSIFSFEHSQDLMVWTERARDAYDRFGLSNLDFLEIGEVI